MPAAPADQNASGLSLSSPRIQSLIDSAPQRGTIALLLAGMIIGLVVAYVIIPTEFTGASPRHMSQQAIEQWVRMVAVGHSQTISYDDSNALLVLQQIPEPQATVRSLAANLQIPLAERQALDAITRIPGFNELDGANAPEDPGMVFSSLQMIASLFIVALCAAIATIIGRGLLGMSGGAAMPDDASHFPETTAAAAPQAGPQATSGFANPSSAPQWKDPATPPSGTMHPQFGAPVLHTMSAFVKGSNYDDSFAIELSHAQGSDFLGECGISAASQVSGELQSVEFWGFDIQTQETLSKFFAAPAAMGDPAMVANIGERVSDLANDIVAAEAGAVQVVESSALIIQAEIKAVVCNYGGGLPNSGIESLQIELMAWYKGAGQAAVPADVYPGAIASPFSEYAEVPVAPPSQSASPPPPPAASKTPQSPKKRPEDEESDPFGGTGNFMPYS
ncbi:MAG: hypothetical protein OXE46_00440 [Chloroflexi bacterium]|nr:hypothetical protein [Chloroflexota bacterium]